MLVISIWAARGYVDKCCSFGGCIVTPEMGPNLRKCLQSQFLRQIVSTYGVTALRRVTPIWDMFGYFLLLTRLSSSLGGLAYFVTPEMGSGGVTRACFGKMLSQRTSGALKSISVFSPISAPQIKLPLDAPIYNCQNYFAPFSRFSPHLTHICPFWTTFTPILQTFAQISWLPY